MTDALGRVFGLFDALALVAVLVAALGIVNTLAMSVVERVREIGVLRAIGMTRRQASRMVVVEATILGLVGAVLGAVVGLGVGAVLLDPLGRVRGLGRVAVGVDRDRRGPRPRRAGGRGLVSVPPRVAASRSSAPSSSSSGAASGGPPGAATRTAGGRRSVC